MQLLSSILYLYQVQPSGKERLILDLRHVNKCLKKYRFLSVKIGGLR